MKDKVYYPEIEVTDLGGRLKRLESSIILLRENKKYELVVRDTYRGLLDFNNFYKRIEVLSRYWDPMIYEKPYDGDRAVTDISLSPYKKNRKEAKEV